MTTKENSFCNMASFKKDFCFKCDFFISLFKVYFHLTSEVKWLSSFGNKFNKLNS